MCPHLFDVIVSHTVYLWDLLRRFSEIDEFEMMPGFKCMLSFKTGFYYDLSIRLQFIKMFLL